MRAVVRRVLTGVIMLSAAAACDVASAPMVKRGEVQPIEAAPDVKPSVRPSDAASDAETSVAELPARIDPEPIATDAPRIVEREDIKVQGEPACAFTIRYIGAVDHQVTWNKEPCSAITTRFMSLADLRGLRKIERLSADTLADLERAPIQPVFYIESTFTASIYPLNSAGRIYEVVVAD